MANLSQNQSTNYKPNEIEVKWQNEWLKSGIYEPDLENSKKPFYNLMMFPYPSAEGLHVGNMYAFTGADVYGRYMRMMGFDVFEPIGLDGFGIHSENYALKVNSHPMEQAQKSEENFYRQLTSIGNGFAWNEKLETYDIDYYRWTQWLFIQLFKAGLSYKAEAQVNWCPSCKTVLADEQVIEGKCERCGTEVVKKMLAQWFFRITNYVEPLLDGLNNIDWTEKVKIAQRNWIGKSEGVRIEFRVINSEFKNNSIEVFTTRPDTLHGATFMVISPEHTLSQNISKENKEIKIYIESAKLKSDEEKRKNKDKTGVFSGYYALNPVNNKKMPIWISDYVLLSYGTGAIMAVPGHDARDYEFAKKYGLDILEVIKGGDLRHEAYTGSGLIVNSGDWDGIKIPHDISKIITLLEDNGLAKKEINYHLRDWLISRQRYWGPPIPMIYCSSCADKGDSWFTTDSAKEYEAYRLEDFEKLNSSMKGWYPEENLPVELPFIDDYKPLGTGNSPLGNHPEFYETNCPRCSEKAVRETDVSDTFLDSSWYFLRYLVTDISSLPIPLAKNSSIFKNEGNKFKNDLNNEEVVKANNRLSFLPVTQYTGGAEHSVLHLLYTRFFYKVLCDLKILDKEELGDEPFPKFFAHGLIIKDGAKMSKSKGNVVVPDIYIKKFGADSLRAYLMFLGPFSGGGDFRDSGIEGMYRFLKRVWVMGTGKNIVSTPLSKSANVILHKTIKGVGEDISDFRYNTALAKMMTLYNTLSNEAEINIEAYEIFLKLLAPFAPHMTEELWSRIKSKGSIHTSKWPIYNSDLIIDEEVVITIQINGKLRDSLNVSKDIIDDQNLIEKMATESDKVQKYLIENTIKKIIYIKGKVINFVV